MVARYTTIPVARVIAFEVNASISPLQSEYIIMSRMPGVPANRAFTTATSRLSPLEAKDARAAYMTQLCDYINQLHSKMPHARGMGALTVIPSSTPATSEQKQWFDEIITISDPDIVRVVHHDTKIDGSCDTKSVQLSLTGLLQDGAAIGPFESPVDIHTPITSAVLDSFETISHFDGCYNSWRN